MDRMPAFFRSSEVGWLVSLCLLVAAAPLTYGDDLEQFRTADAKLNQVYGAVRQGLDQSRQSLLKSAQRSWITFKEKDFAIFSDLARIARDPERIYRYQVEETDGRTQAVMFLGKSPPQEDTEPEPKTAREADQMLNNIYRECLQLLPSDRVQTTKETQSLWIEFRDLHCRLDAAFRRGQIEDSVLRELTVRRVIQFRHYMKVLLETQLPAPEFSRRLEEDSEAEISGPPATDPFRFAK